MKSISVTTIHILTYKKMHSAYEMFRHIWALEKGLLSRKGLRSRLV